MNYTDPDLSVIHNLNFKIVDISVTRLKPYEVRIIVLILYRENLVRVKLRDTYTMLYRILIAENV